MTKTLSTLFLSMTLAVPVGLLAQQTTDAPVQTTTTAPLTKGQMKDQRKTQKAEEKAAKEQAKSASEQSKALKHQNKATNAAEKAQAKQPSPAAVEAAQPTAAPPTPAPATTTPPEM